MNRENERVLILENGKKSILRVVFGRTGIVVFLILMQALLLWTGFNWLNELLPLFLGVSGIIEVGVVLHILNNDENPIVKLTWSILIMLFPLLGILLYLYIKSDIGHRFVKARYNQILKDSKQFISENKEITKKLEEAPGNLYGMSRYLQYCDFQTYENTSVKYFQMGEQKFEEMLRQLEQASKFIFMEYFIVDEGYMWGRILDVLERKAKQGVEVRVMYDGMCSLYLLPYNYPKKLQEMGIQCRMFSPLRPLISTHYNNRDHRKILVVDGKVAFTGGVNLADEYINRREVYGKWKDTAIMLKGEAVRSLTLMFLQMWNISNAKTEDFTPYLDCTEPVVAEGFVIPYGDSPLDKDLVGEMVYMNIINQAKKYVHIMTPYLILDNEMITALIMAVKRGVEVKLILPHIPDKEYAFALAHSHYAQLIENGIEIYEYIPGFVHAKVFVSDDVKAVVGTINLDYRSLYHHFECATYLHNVPAIADIEMDMQKTLQECMLMTPAELSKDSWKRKVMGKALKLFAPLM